MKTRMKIEKPEDVEITLTITQSAKDWELLREQLMTKWPSGELIHAISDLLSQTRKILWRSEGDK